MAFYYETYDEIAMFAQAYSCGSYAMGSWLHFVKILKFRLKTRDKFYGIRLKIS